MYASDPYYSYVELLLPMFGSFGDLSKNRHQITPSGSAEVTTAQSKYYGSSGYFNHSDGCFLIGPAAFDLGAADFCIEFWLRIPSLPAANDWQEIISKRYNFSVRHGFTVVLDQLTGIPFLTWTSDGSTVKTFFMGGAAFPTNTWKHVAFTRSGGTLRRFIDGVLSWTDTTQIGTSAIYHTTSEVLSIGRILLNGYLQDLRVTKGVPRYTENFTPPRRLIETMPWGFAAVDANATLGSISGTITNRLGAGCQRKVYAVSRSDQIAALSVIIAHTLSDPATGAYELIVPSGEEVTRVVVSRDFDDSPLLNDLVDRVIQT